ncbi:MAG: hypothetical protein LBT44_09120 [Clostridiales bacterium]|jgi:hypothetical protein|nr:hypothetical protein [Clostridiales bacterium]
MKKWILLTAAFVCCAMMTPARVVGALAPEGSETSITAAGETPNEAAPEAAPEGTETGEAAVGEPEEAETGEPVAASPPSPAAATPSAAASTIETPAPADAPIAASSPAAASEDKYFIVLLIVAVVVLAGGLSALSIFVFRMYALLFVRGNALLSKLDTLEAAVLKTIPPEKVTVEITADAPLERAAILLESALSRGAERAAQEKRLCEAQAARSPEPAAETRSHLEIFNACAAGFHITLPPRFEATDFVSCGGGMFAEDASGQRDGKFYKISLSENEYEVYPSPVFLQDEGMRPYLRILFTIRSLPAEKSFALLSPCYLYKTFDGRYELREKGEIG